MCRSVLHKTLSKLCSGCGSYWERRVFQPPGVCWKNTTKTSGGAAWLPLPTSSPPKGWGSGSGRASAGVGPGVGLIWADLQG